MFDRIKTTRIAVTLVHALCAVIISVAAPSLAAADNLGGARFEGSVSCGHRFEPGPIVNGHNRQPTPAEFEARMQELHSEQAFAGSTQGQAGACRTRQVVR
jgi:hypothetical protein